MGRALTASLDLKTILSAIHTQVAELMSADNFYIALYDHRSDEITFPIEIENGKRVQQRAHQKGSELAEYILRTQRPLLIRKGMNLPRENQGLDPIEKPPASFLGVPMIAGKESLGVIVVQSYDKHGIFDTSHKEVLITIASQAAIAIQNAGLYATTDQALANRVQELDSILRTTNEGILLLDVNWKVLAANRTLARYLGMSQHVIDGASLGSRREDNGNILLQILGYSAEGLREDCRELKEGKVEFKKKTISLSQNPERHFDRTLTPVRDRSGEVRGYLFVLRDLTEERQLANLRNEMTHMLIHDLRSPLTSLQSVINVVIESLEEGKVEEAQHLLSLAQHSGDKMLKLIDELLEISQLEGDQIPLKLRAVEVEKIITHVVSQISPMAEKVQISVEVEVDPRLHEIKVDAEYIERVLNNLLDNAYKFTPDGGMIKVWARRVDQAGAAGVLIGVSDTGPGIPESEQNRLFKKFQQAISNKGRRTGTGLGLVYCKLAVEAHGGKIWVESEPGKGSTFLINLPAPA
jgi:PAS domain S-box-containing protein